MKGLHHLRVFCGEWVSLSFFFSPGVEDRTHGLRVLGKHSASELNPQRHEGLAVIPCQKGRRAKECVCERKREKGRGQTHPFNSNHSHNEATPEIAALVPARGQSFLM